MNTATRSERASSPAGMERRPEDTACSAAAIEAEHLTVSYGPKPALLDVSVSIAPGRLVGIIGPNGAGKSTFIKAVLGFVAPDFGNLRIFGQPIARAAGTLAYVPQRGSVDWDFPITVRDVVMMGRYGRIPFWRNPGAGDETAIDHALELVRMKDYKTRQIGQLSGGQQQRVFLARALAQSGQVLLLDEPFAGVDAATEHAILEVLNRARDDGRTLLVVHHDLATAGEYFDRLMLLKQRLVAYGPPEHVLRENLLSEVYEGKLKIFGSLRNGDSNPVLPVTRSKADGRERP